MGHGVSQSRSPQPVCYCDSLVECSVCMYVCVAGQPKTSEHLHRAIHRGDTELTRSIIETRCAAFQSTRTPTHTIQSLLSLPSPQYVDTPDIYGLSPLMNACRLGNARFPHAQSARLLPHTVPHFSHSIAELLLDLGADKEYCNKAGKTR